jgi:hypothetical protein
LYNAAGGLESSAEVENDNPAVGIVLLLVIALWLGRWTIGVDGQLNARPISLDTAAFLFLSSPNLVDDEGRKHAAPRFRDWDRS